MRKTWIIKTGTTFPDTRSALGDFDVWTRDALGLDAATVSVFDVERDQTLPDPDTCAGIVITGAHAMVTDELAWSLRLEEWIPGVVEAEVPMLGICYGHQLIAKAMGGTVGYHPQGREIGTVEIELLESCRSDRLFGGLEGTLWAHVVHAQTVIQLPRGAIRLASNAFESTHAFRLGAYTWGVQFHPEYSGAIMRSYIEALADELRAASCDAWQSLQAVRETPVAGSLLRQFAACCTARGN